ERRLERAARVVGRVEAVVELAGDVDARAVDAGAGDAVADARLVAVHLGGVDVAVADGQRAPDRLGGVLRRDLEDAESELRNRVAVVQGEIRSGGHCPSRTRNGSDRR